MKPIKLEISGLNSFEEKQVIDFSNFSGSFGIFGKTGSGKSTIFDAITLALYGKINRDGKRKSFINSNLKTAKVSLEFEAVVSKENKLFKIERTFEKDNLQDAEVSCKLFVFENDWTLVSAKTEQIDADVLQIIGLDYEEFSKCVALPQGEFAAFLKSSKEERIKIMSKIFGLEKYGEALTNSAKQKYDELSAKIAEVSATLKPVLYADDETLSAKKEEFLILTGNYEETKNKLKQKNDEFGESSLAVERKNRFVELSKTIDELEKDADEMKALEVEISKHQVANQSKLDFEKLQKMVQDETELSNKLSDLNENKLQANSALYESQTQLEEMRRVHTQKMIELRGKLEKFEDLKKVEKELKDFENSLAKVDIEIKEKNVLLASYQEKLSYICSQSTKLEGEIQEINEFVLNHQPDTDICLALEQTKEIESELILINDFCLQIENLVDQTNDDIKAVQEEYNSLVKEESEVNSQSEKIASSIEVAFEDVDDTPFKKLRSCDEQVIEMQTVSNNIELIDENIEQLKSQIDANNQKLHSLSDQIDNSLFDLSQIDKQLSNNEIDINKTREFREELLGENILSILSNHLPVGNNCPVCGNLVMQKMYCEVGDLKPVESEIESKLTNQKSTRFEKEKLVKSLASARTLFDYLTNENDKLYKQTDALEKSKLRLYQMFVDATETAPEDFKKLKEIVIKTSNSLENLILLQENLSLAKERILVSKTIAGTKLSIYKNQVENLIEILYGLQKKKAEREFAIFDVNEKNKDLEEYQKQISQGISIQQVIDNKKYNREKLRDNLHELDKEKSEVQEEVAKLCTEISVLEARKDNFEREVKHSKSILLTSGVPEDTNVEAEKVVVKQAMEKLDFDLETAESKFESSKEYLFRVEKNYEIQNSVLVQKKVDISELEKVVDNIISENGFDNREDFEKFFISQNELKNKQNTLMNYSTAVRVATIQKKELENENLNELNEDYIKNLKNEIEKLSKQTQALSEKVGFTSSELEKIEKDNQTRQALLELLEQLKAEFEVASELLKTLQQKSFDGFMIDKYLKEITAVANEKLSYLVDGKYELVYENEEFFVKDNFNSAKTRPASTLSGGETFLVSLSLALSISEAISTLSSKKLKFFILDEGFGTLDSEAVETLALALNKLESKDMMLGLITHSTELEDNLKNKIYVEKLLSGSKVKIVKCL